jgi:predicted nucleic-acid-binding protein
MNKFMHAIDTNVLVRIIVKDDETQTLKAKKYVEKLGEVFISLVVLCEFSWVLTSIYELNRSEFSQVIENILKTNQFLIEASDIVWDALHEYKKSNVDFSDCLIGSIAKHHKCTTIATFDKKACRIALFKLIE